MHAFLPLAGFLAAALCVWWVVRAADAFERLWWADRTQDARLASYCGVNQNFLPERVVRCEPTKLYPWAP